MTIKIIAVCPNCKRRIDDLPDNIPIKDLKCPQCQCSKLALFHEIRPFWVKIAKVGKGQYQFLHSDTPKRGYTLHPAFYQDKKGWLEHIKRQLDWILFPMNKWIEKHCHSRYIQLHQKEPDPPDGLNNHGEKHE